MTEKDRTELFAALETLAKRYPHWRVGQLVANVAGWADVELWDAEDEQLLVAAQKHLMESGGNQRIDDGLSQPHRRTGAAS
jgi:hypothetical protein